MTIWMSLILILFFLLNQVETLITSLVMGVLRNIFSYIMFLILRQSNLSRDILHMDINIVHYMYVTNGYLLS